MAHAIALLLLLILGGGSAHAAEETFGIRLEIREPLQSSMITGPEIAHAASSRQYDAALGLSRNPSHAWLSDLPGQVECFERPPLTPEQIAAGASLPAEFNLPLLSRARHSCFVALSPAADRRASGRATLTLLYQ